MGVIRLGDNDRDWTLGNAVMGTAWGARRINSNLSASLRGIISGWGDVDGRDAAPSVDPTVVPTARTDLRYGTRADVGLGLNVSFPRAKGLRFAGELLLPFYQDLNGPQLETDWQLVFGAQLVAVQR